MNCKSCGNILVEGSVFCLHCGNKVDTGQAQAQPNNQMPNQQAPNVAYAASKKPPGLGGTIATLACSAVALVAAAAFILSQLGAINIPFLDSLLHRSEPRVASTSASSGRGDTAGQTDEGQGNIGETGAAASFSDNAGDTDNGGSAINTATGPGAQNGVYTLLAWGNNRNGQLGDGTNNDKLMPVAIMDNVVGFSAGYRFSMAIMDDGSLWAWGDNEYGQLGDGTTDSKSSPVKIMEDVKYVSAGYNACFAIKSDSSLWGWGSLLYMQIGIGDGTAERHLSPVKIMDDVASVSTPLSGRHVLAIKNDGSLWAWGENGFGQFGNGTTESSLLPVKIMDEVKVVKTGGYNSMAIKNDGTLWAWGSNNSGQLGDGTKIDQLNPVKIMENCINVSLTNYGSIALDSDGSIWFWGDGAYEINGNRMHTTMLEHHKIMDDAIFTGAGTNHMLAIKTDSSLWAWGFNGNGQLGDNTMTDRYTPVYITENVINIDAGWGHNLALIQSGARPTGRRATVNDFWPPPDPPPPPPPRPPEPPITPPPPGPPITPEPPPPPGDIGYYYEGTATCVYYIWQDEDIAKSILLDNIKGTYFEYGYGSIDADQLNNAVVDIIYQWQQNGPMVGSTRDVEFFFGHEDNNGFAVIGSNEGPVVSLSHEQFEYWFTYDYDRNFALLEYLNAYLYEFYFGMVMAPIFSMTYDPVPYGDDWLFSFSTVNDHDIELSFKMSFYKDENGTPCVTGVALLSDPNSTIFAVETYDLKLVRAIEGETSIMNWLENFFDRWMSIMTSEGVDMEVRMRLRDDISGPSSNPLYDMLYESLPMEFEIANLPVRVKSYDIERGDDDNVLISVYGENLGTADSRGNIGPNIICTFGADGQIFEPDTYSFLIMGVNVTGIIFDFGRLGRFTIPDTITISSVGAIAQYTSILSFDP